MNFPFTSKNVDPHAGILKLEVHSTITKEVYTPGAFAPLPNHVIVHEVTESGADGHTADSDPKISVDKTERSPVDG